jgi:hypothetical protein
MAKGSVGLGGIFLFVLLVVWLNVFSRLDRAGWVYHKRIVAVFADADWAKGTVRRCLGTQPSSEDGLTALFCSADPKVQPVGVKVKFWGRLSRPDTMQGPITAEYHWDCTKTSSSYDCKAID